MKRKIFYLLLILQFPLLMQAQQYDYVKLYGRQFYDENNDAFYPVCMNYYFDIGNTDQQTDYYIMPHINYGESKDFDCANQNDCYDKIDYDLAKIHQMGFNTIHLIGIAPDSDDNNGFYVTTFNNVNWWNMTSVVHYLQHPYVSDNFIQLLFGWMDMIIVKAHDAGLKVIIDCQKGDGFKYTNFSTDMVEYLTAPR